MPLSKIVLRPGVNKETTTYGGEGGWFETQLVRFRSGNPEKIYGWVRDSTSTIRGVCTALWNWASLSSDNLLAVGTNQKLYVQNSSGSTYNDITPWASTGTLLSANPLTTTNTSTTVNVFQTAHGLSTGNYVAIYGAATVNNVTLYGFYQITEVDANNYTVVAATPANNNGAGGGSVIYVVAATTLGTNPFATTSGSQLVTVTQNAHGATIGQYVLFMGATTVNGLTLNGEYEIVDGITANTYTISAGASASGSGSGGGTGVAALYRIASGTVNATIGTGWGSGAWSSGSWGLSVASVLASNSRLWSIDNFGQNLVAAVRGGAIYYWQVNNSMIDSNPATYTPANTLAFQATAAGYSGSFVPSKVLGVKTSDVQEFAIAFGANNYDPTNANTAFNPMLVRWSDQQNIFDWTQTDVNQGGEQQLSHGTSIIAWLSTRQEIIVWTDGGIFSMQYVGTPYVWGFSLILDNISIVSPNAMASASNVVYWMGNGKFYSYAGQVNTLPCTLRSYVFDNFNTSQAAQVVCGTNETYSEVWWFYPSASSQVNDSYVIYNYLDQVWYHGNIPRSAWLDTPLRAFPLGAFSVQTSYLPTALNSTATSIVLINGASYPNPMLFPYTGYVIIDSEQITFTGVTGNTLTGCTRGANGTTAASHAQYAAVNFAVPNQIMQHENGCDDASVNPPVAMNPYVTSSDFDIGDGDHFAFVKRMLPDVTFENSTAANPQVQMIVEARRNSGAAYDAFESPTVTQTVAPVYSPAPIVIEQYTGQVYTRIRDRQMKLQIQSSMVGVAWQWGACRLDLRQSGRK